MAVLKEKLDAQRRERYNQQAMDKEDFHKPFMTEFPYSKNKSKGIHNRFEPLSPSQMAVQESSEESPQKAPSIVTEEGVELDNRKLDKHELITYKAIEKAKNSNRV